MEFLRGFRDNYLLVVALIFSVVFLGKSAKTDQ